MLIFKTEKQVKEVEVEVENYNECDKCKTPIITANGDAFDFTLEYVTGEAYDRGGSGKTKEMELCKKCSDQCIKLLEDNGYRITDREWDF